MPARQATSCDVSSWPPEKSATVNLLYICVRAGGIEIIKIWLLKNKIISLFIALINFASKPKRSLWSILNHST